MFRDCGISWVSSLSLIVLLYLLSLWGLVEIRFAVFVDSDIDAFCKTGNADE